MTDHASSSGGKARSGSGLQRPGSLPRVLLSVAVSFDGFLDDSSPSRLMLSSPEDADAVDALRACSDAILIGAGTARQDDPVLTVRSEPRRTARILSGDPASPWRVIVTRSGNLPTQLRVFQGDASTIVYCESATALRLKKLLPAEVAVRGLPDLSLRMVLQDLAVSGVRRLLIEAGQAISTTVMRDGLADELRVAWAPVLVGDGNAPRFAGDLALAAPARISLDPWRVDVLGQTVMLHYVRREGSETCRSHFVPRTDAGWLAEAIELSRNCPPTDRAFSVGAIIVDAEGTEVSRGFSRELSEWAHAEEVAITKAHMAGKVLKGCTLYSSMEPCSVRLSRRRPCTSHIIEASIARVVYALREPPVFVHGRGHRVLEEAGVTVSQIPELAGFVEEVNTSTMARRG